MEMTLQRKLTETNMKCVPDGVHHIDEIYKYVEENHDFHILASRLSEILLKISNKQQ